MSGRDMTRRGVVALLALMSLVSFEPAFADADDEAFAERFVTFDPPVPMTPVALLDRRGRAAVLAPRPGRTTLIALWATWCPACHRDVPRLAAARPSLAKAGIDIALVNIDAAAIASVLARSADIPTRDVPLFFDPDGSRLAVPSPDGRRSPFHVFGMPILFAVDPDQRVRGYVKGSVDWTNPDVEAFFRAWQ